jgi:argininosuccinate lyase
MWVMSRKNPIARSGRFSEDPSQEVRDFSESISFDWKLYRQDIAGSIAHCRMLGEQGILPKSDVAKIVKGLEQIRREIDQNRFKWDPNLEDVHMNIEAELTRRVPAAARLHTARSRNDQVSTDMRLWVMDSIQNVHRSISHLQKSLLELAERSRIVKGKRGKGTPGFISLPGYTHLQRAQPVLVPHYLMAYMEMFGRDADRFQDCLRRTDVSPLGSGAIAGTSLPINRERTASLLGFSRTSENSMDAVSDRDFIAEFLFAASLTGIHLSRLSEDFVIWSTVEFGFLKIGDSYTTGSSLMPQKKNPDVAELGRGKSGRLIGNLMGLLTLLKGLPMTYNRDLQDDKTFLFDSAEVLLQTLKVFTGMLKSSEFVAEKCMRAVADPMMLATEIVDVLVRKGVPFREAHHAVGSAVQYAERKRISLAEIAMSDWKRIHPKAGPEIARALRIENFFSSRDRLRGAPGNRQVELQLKAWRSRLKG